MKIALIALAVCSLTSASVFAETVAQGQEAVSHAGRMLSASEARVNDAQQVYNDAAYQQGNGVNGSVAESNLNKAASDRAAAQAQMNGAINTLANAVATAPAPAQGPAVNATSYRLGITQQQQKMVGSINAVSVNNTSSINVAASSLKPSTPVNVTVNGVTQTVTASSLAPSIQVSVPFESAFMRTSVKGGVDSHSHVSSHVQGDNNGNSNQHANAMGAHGQNGQRSGRSAAVNF